MSLMHILMTQEKIKIYGIILKIKKNLKMLTL